MSGHTGISSWGHYTHGQHYYFNDGWLGAGAVHLLLYYSEAGDPSFGGVPVSVASVASAAAASKPPSRPLDSEEGVPAGQEKGRPAVEKSGEFSTTVDSGGESWSVRLPRLPKPFWAMPCGYISMEAMFQAETGLGG